MEILRTERLRLRQFTAADADADFMLALLNEPDWHRYINDPGVRTREQALAWMEGRLFEPYRRLGHGFWAVELLSSPSPASTRAAPRGGDAALGSGPAGGLADGELIGLCGLFKRDSLPEVDVGYGFLTPHRGRGYAREAAAACLAHGHETLGMKTILAITLPENLASARVLTAIGMRDLGVRVLEGNDYPSQLFESRC